MRDTNTGTGVIEEVTRMDEPKRHVLVVEQNPELRRRFVTSFAYAGYNVEVTDKVIEAAEMLFNGDMFDLVVVDISDMNHLDFVAKVQRINLAIPVLTVIDNSDKSLIIELLNLKRVEFIEHFIESHARASCPSFHGSRHCEAYATGDLQH